jgi:mRNA interferase RelE/StbE
MWYIIISKSASKNLKKIPKSYQDEVLIFLKELESGPAPFGYDLKKMQGEENLFRCRIGVYRILYEVLRKEIIINILDINHRKDIYK